jgi:hypothetical protein
MPCNDYGQSQKSAAALVAKYNEALKKYEAIAPAASGSANGKGWINPAPLPHSLAALAIGCTP